MVQVRRPKPNIDVRKPADEAAVQTATQATFDMGQAMQLEQMRLQQEQLRYLQTLRTGKPAAVEKPAAKPASSMLETERITREVESVMKFQDVIVNASDKIRPNPNPFETFFNSKFGEGIGEGIGSFLADELRDWRRARREHGPTPATVSAPAQVQRPSPPPALPSPASPPSGFLGTAPGTKPPANPVEPARQIGEVTMKLSPDDKAAFQQMAQSVDQLARVVLVQQERIEAIEKRRRRGPSH